MKKARSLEGRPLVSVCIITYNHEKYIAQALESVLMQKVNFSWEIIIADDCSKDKTREIINSYHKKHPDLIRLLYQEKNVGGGKNFVDLIHSAKGKYIAYLEGDDYWTDDRKLQKQYDFMVGHPDVSLCYHQVSWNFTYSDERNGQVSNCEDKPFYTLKEVLENGWFIRSGSMFFVQIKLPKDFHKLYIGDYPLHLLLAKKGNVGFIKEVMSVYRINNAGISETVLLKEGRRRKVSLFFKNLKLQLFLMKNLSIKYWSVLIRRIFVSLFILIKYFVSGKAEHQPK